MSATCMTTAGPLLALNWARQVSELAPGVSLNETWTKPLFKHTHLPYLAQIRKCLNNNWIMKYLFRKKKKTFFTMFYNLCLINQSSLSFLLILSFLPPSLSGASCSHLFTVASISFSVVPQVNRLHLTAARKHMKFGLWRDSINWYEAFYLSW